MSNPQTDLKVLISKGHSLYMAMRYECFGDEYVSELSERLGATAATERIEALPSFRQEYQSWYSEAKALIGQVLPGRLDDFTRYYEPPRNRKQLRAGTYTIEDYLHGLRNGYVEPSAAIPNFNQQLAILTAAEARFESSLFDIRQLTQADLFDSEIEAARTLAKNGFLRAAGAVAGVVLEKHLKEVCASHGLTVRKRRPQLADLNDLLKQENVAETEQWRFNQRLADLRNLCDHDRETEPTRDQVNDLIDGVDKVIKTLF